MRILETYRRSPYSIIFSRWKKHLIHLLALIGFVTLAYLALKVAHG